MATLDDLPEVTAKGPAGRPRPLRLVANDVSPGRQIRVLVSPDAMHAYALIVPGERFAGVQPSDIAVVMARGGVVCGMLEDGLKFLAKAMEGESPFDGFFEVARGVPAQKGEDGYIEFHVQPTSLDPRYDENDAGAIDFKQLNLIENCFIGQRVATIHPPGPGRPGQDVFGATIPPTPGEPMAVEAGPGIRASAGERDFTSEVEGRLVYEGGRLSVSPLLEIHRDVDYSVGNVDFVGKILVRGSLLDGFYINAKRGVEITGDVGASRITSDGDVKITGGIKGKNAAMISCRNLAAHYIDDASVEAMGDVSATKEIMNSSVKALGRITVAVGAVIGGVACAFRGVEADTLGSDMGVATRVMSGLNWTEENRKDAIRHQLAEYMDRIQSAKMILDQLFDDKEVSVKLGADQKTLLADISGELRELREMMAELLDERARIVGRSQVGMVNQINVRKMLYMGVTTKFSEVECEVKDSIKGPISLLQDSRRNYMETQALVPLPEPVRRSPSEIAAAFLAGVAAGAGEEAPDENGEDGDGPEAPADAPDDSPEGGGTP